MFSCYQIRIRYNFESIIYSKILTYYIITKYQYMYAIIDFLCLLITIAGIVLAIVFQYWYLAFIAIPWFLLYPIILEIFYNAFAMIGPKFQYELDKPKRFVYSPSYNLSFLGLQNLHPFDSHKYQNIWKKLLQRKLVTEQDRVEPNRMPRRLLGQVVSKCYLIKLMYSIWISSAIELPLCFLFSFLLRWRVLNPMLCMTEGSVLAAICATKLGWAINIGGGFHHACSYQGGGFCVYPDITLVRHYLQTRLRIKKIMIIDLDAHQGNGYELDHLQNNTDVFIADCYNHRIYPGDRQAKKAINNDISINSHTTDEQFLQAISSIQKDINNFKPQFIIYNAGTDILEDDPLGGCIITQAGIISRDQYIFRLAIERKIPIVMVLSGGYQKSNAEVIANSIQNIMKKF